MELLLKFLIYPYWNINMLNLQQGINGALVSNLSILEYKSFTP